MIRRRILSAAEDVSTVPRRAERAFGNTRRIRVSFSVFSVAFAIVDSEVDDFFVVLETHPFCPQGARFEIFVLSWRIGRGFGYIELCMCGVLLTCPTCEKIISILLKNLSSSTVYR